MTGSSRAYGLAAATLGAAYPNVVRQLAKSMTSDAYKGTKSMVTRSMKKPWAKQSSRKENQRITSSPKRYVLTSNLASRSANDQVFLDLTSIAQGDDIDQRFRQRIFVRGVKINMYWRNLQVHPAIFHWAVVQPRGQLNLDATTINADFFSGNLASKAVDFDAVASWQHKDMYNINPTRWKVHAHGRRELGALDGTTTTYIQNDRDNYFILNKYVPVNDFVDYDGAGSTTSQNGLLLVCWLVDITTNTSTPVTAGCAASLSGITFYKDVI